ncbi:MAG: type II toxin-antitoxin system VapC family toxin [Dehalococcoidia bacterium]|nr:type II toxin-antitoxin system VapC family toxin [Dehalococcoidia bacterium]
MAPIGPGTRRTFDTLVVASDVLPLTQPIMRRWGEARGHLRKRGMVVADMDLLIGCTAVEHDLEVVTRNRRHFDRIPGVRIAGLA